MEGAGRQGRGDPGFPGVLNQRLSDGRKKMSRHSAPNYYRVSSNVFLIATMTHRTLVYCQDQSVSRTNYVLVTHHGLWQNVAVEGTRERFGIRKRKDCGRNFHRLLKIAKVMMRNRHIYCAFAVLTGIHNKSMESKQGCGNLKGEEATPTTSLIYMLCK